LLVLLGTYTKHEHAPKWVQMIAHDVPFGVEGVRMA
jgi:hypothetical protein